MAKGKKKRNRQCSDAPVPDPLSAGNSSDSEESKSQPTNILKHPCTHVNKSVNINTVRKRLQKVILQCSEPECNNNTIEELYVCTQCGSFHCSTLETNHILKHQNTPRSDSHSIVINVESLIILCQDCKKEILVSSSKKLQSVIDLINHMKEVQTEKQKMNDLPVQGCPTEADAQFDKFVSDDSPKKCNRINEPDFDAEDELVQKLLKEAFERSEKNVTNNIECSNRPRGLNNLGNTCFYNSVLQCLAQTPFLKQVLLDCESGEPITIQLDNEDITVKQEKWYPLTENLYTTLQEITNGRDSTFTPNNLLDSLRKKCKMFIGYSQHDSHELLRHLLDSVRDDDLKRYQKTIVHHYGLSMRVDPTEVDEKKANKIKEISKKLQDLLLRPDHVFKGQLLSVVQCQTCGHKSEVTESFLDLSLPISADKTNSSLSFQRKKDNDVFSQSKHQAKKERKLALKQGRRKKHEQKQFNNKLQDTLVVNNDADIEDNMEIETNEIEMSDWKNENKENPESGYGSEKQPSNVTSPLSITELTTLMNNTPLADPDRQINADRILDSEKPMDLDSVLPGSPANSPSSPQGSSLDSMRANVSPDYMDVGTDSANENQERNNPTPNVSDNNSDGFDDSKSEEDIDDDDEEEGEFSQECPQATLQPQPICDDSECSVLTCLNQFTASEIMNGNNKVSCERCTEQHKQKTNEDKTIYRQSTKQMLISSPPAILILHLKRFQMCYSTTRKMTKDVSFPWVLDISPYCSVKCQKLIPGQNRILYSLYGVVEHTGFLHSGHYIAYVKVRDSVKDESYRFSFLEGSKTKPPKIIDSNDDPSHLAPSGTWYYISDSMVRQVSSTVVQNCQAYLLFYERIL